jgi:biopolymer transport protein ExbB/TolQ
MKALLSSVIFFGKPPVLSSEDEKQFGETFHQVAECVQPKDMVEMIYLWHFVCASWIIWRYIRHSTVAIERFAKQNREFRVQRAKLREERRSAQMSREVEKLTEGPADVARMAQLERVHEDTINDTDAIFETSDLERDHNKALAQSILFQQQLNALIVSQTRIRDEALRQLDLYRKGLGKLASDATDAALKSRSEGGSAMETVDAPSIVPGTNMGVTAGALLNEGPDNGESA